MKYMCNFHNIRIDYSYFSNNSDSWNVNLRHVVTVHRIQLCLMQNYFTYQPQYGHVFIEKRNNVIIYNIDKYCFTLDHLLLGQISPHYRIQITVQAQCLSCPMDDGEVHNDKKLGFTP